MSFATRAAWACASAFDPDPIRMDSSMVTLSLSHQDPVEVELSLAEKTHIGDDARGAHNADMLGIAGG